MIKIPEGFNYFEIYLTFQCNQVCPYCINKHSILNKDREQMCGKDWVEWINKIEFGNLPLTLGGGEPTMHSDFFYILENVRPEIQIDMLTNLRFDLPKFIKNVSPNRFNRYENPAYKSIRVSYHPTQIDARELVTKVKILQDNAFKIGIFGINHPEHMQANIIMSELARKNKVYFFIKDFLGYYNKQLFGYYKYPEALDGFKKNVKCRTHEILVSPEGKIYRCHRDLYKKCNEIKKIDFKFRECDAYGLCNPCDCKNKANRFLEMGHCSIEIKE